MIINQQWLSGTMNRAATHGDLTARATLVSAIEQGGILDSEDDAYWHNLVMITQYAQTLASNPALARCLMMTKATLEAKGTPTQPALVDMILVECGDDPETMDLNTGNTAMDYFIAHRGSYLSYWAGNLDVLKACTANLSIRDGSPKPEMAPLVFEISLAMQHTLECKEINLPELCTMARVSGDVLRACRLLKCAFPNCFDSIDCVICQGGEGHD